MDAKWKTDFIFFPTNITLKGFIVCNFDNQNV